MPRVQTVSGAIHAADLGVVAMHEHLIFALPGWQDNPFISWDREASIRHKVEELRRASDAGLRTFVDATAIGVGRDIPFMREVARQSGVNVVACTGWWLAMGITSHFSTQEPELLARIMVHELTVGIGATGARAGLIKVATSEDAMDPAEANVLRAAGRAQAETGCLITTHTSRSTLGLDQIDLITSHGGRADRIIIGHSDDRDDIDYLRRILATGATVEFDHIGKQFMLTDQRKAELLAELIREGHTAQLTISLDWVGEIVDRPDAPPGPMKRVEPAYLITGFLPLLRAEGVSDDMIQQMIVGNPARLLPYGE